MTLLDGLPAAQRLASVYTKAEPRERFLCYFALDARLAGIVRNSREPMLAQLRLAWWREQLTRDHGPTPRGEPLLVVLRCWRDDRPVLAGLVDGWEGLTGDAPLPLAVFEELANARANILAAVDGIGDSADAFRMGRNVALADLASRLSHEAERDAVRALTARQDWTQSSLPRALRPLAMLHALAARNFAADKSVHAMGPLSALAMIRIGLLGR